MELPKMGAAQVCLFLYNSKYSLHLSTYFFFFPTEGTGEETVPMTTHKPSDLSSVWLYVFIYLVRNDTPGAESIIQAY
jgi:hypothetical protein